MDNHPPRADHWKIPVGSSGRGSCPLELRRPPGALELMMMMMEMMMRMLMMMMLMRVLLEMMMRMLMMMMLVRRRPPLGLWRGSRGEADPRRNAPTRLPFAAHCCP